MDHRMPDMDGVEATGHIRALGNNDPYYLELPIIALTANAMVGMKEMFLQNGFNDFMSKPIDTTVLNTILEKYIPKYMQTGAVEVVNPAAAKERPRLSALQIKGLDTAKGIRQIGSSAEFYNEILATFYEDGKERIIGINKCLETGDLSGYVTLVHALKSAAANIGADKMFEIAHALETAGYKKDIAFIEANNGHFIETFTQLLNDIDGALSSLSANGNGEALSEQLLSELDCLKAALTQMDAGVIYPTINRLMEMKLHNKVKTVVRQIWKHIMSMEYDEAFALIESFVIDDPSLGGPSGL
jgi:CheY-like chemotaxis protein